MSYAAGVDVGSTQTKAIVVDEDLKIVGRAIIDTGANVVTAAEKAFQAALKNGGIPDEEVEYIVGTGYGRYKVTFGNTQVTEISCHARGAVRMFPGTRTVLDMGGQDTKAIRVRPNGEVVDFCMNDKCAAGTGRGMEVFADLMQVPIEQLGELSLQVDKEPEPVSSTCVVFAKSEAVGLLRKGWRKNAVLAAYCNAMAHRVCTLLERISIQKDFAITGGIAKNVGVVTRLEKELGVQAIKPTFDTQIAGAVGAALFGKAIAEQEKK